MSSSFIFSSPVATLKDSFWSKMREQMLQKYSISGSSQFLDIAHFNSRDAKTTLDVSSTQMVALFLQSIVTIAILLGGVKSWDDVGKSFHRLFNNCTEGVFTPASHLLLNGYNVQVSFTGSVLGDQPTPLLQLIVLWTQCVSLSADTGEPGLHLLRFNPVSFLASTHLHFSLSKHFPLCT